MSEKSVFFYQDFDRYDEKAAAKNLTPDALPSLKALQAALTGLAEWNAASIQAAVDGTAASIGAKLGVVAQPLRVAVAGNSISPPIDQTLALLGRERSLARVGRAIAFIEGR
jgi:glutamyl-tRNA synthetase